MVCETHLTTYINLYLEAIISVSRGLFCREPYTGYQIHSQMSRVQHLRLEGIQASLALWLIKTERELISYNFCIQVKIISNCFRFHCFQTSPHAMASHAAAVVVWFS